MHVSGQTITISDSGEIDEDIFVEADGVLRLTARELTLKGDLTVDGGRVEIVGCAVYVPSRFNHERIYTMKNGATLAIERSTWRNDFHLDLHVKTGSRFAARDVEVTGIFTVSVTEASRVELDRTQKMGEFIVGGDCVMTASASSHFLVWLWLGRQFNGELAFPDGAHVQSWSAQPIQEVTVTDCREVLWAFITTEGADGVVRDSRLRAVASVFSEGADARLEGLRNLEEPPGGVFDSGDRRLRFENCRVVAWNFYVEKNARLTLENCLLGETWGLADEGVMRIVNSTVDGTGGNVRAQGRTRLEFNNCMLLCNAVADQDATIALTDCRVANNLFAVRNGRVEMTRTEVLGAGDEERKTQVTDL